MLSAITLGLRGLQMILAIALLGLSVSLIHWKCHYAAKWCVMPVAPAFDKSHAPRTVSYCIFLGIYGILISVIGTIALFIDRIPTNVPLLGDSFGALCYLAGGVAWVVSIGGRLRSCSEWENVEHGDLDWSGIRLPSYDDDFLKIVTDWLKGVAGSACRQGEAEHGLAWALFAFTAGLAICDYFRRRDQVKSSK